MLACLGIEDFRDKKLVVMKLIAFLEKLLLEILGSDVAEPCRGLGIYLGLHVDDIRDMSLVILVVLEELREILRVRSVFPSIGH